MDQIGSTWKIHNSGTPNDIGLRRSKQPNETRKSELEKDRNVTIVA